jgi:carbamoyltransferase
MTPWPQGIESIVEALNKSNIAVVKQTVDYDEHHLYHAANGFYMSGFDDAVCIVVDGMGVSKFIELKVAKANNVTSTIEKQIIETTSIYHASYPNSFKPLYQRYRHFPFVFTAATDAPSSRDVCRYISGLYDYEVDVVSNLDLGTMYTAVGLFCGYQLLEGPGKVMGLSGYGNPNPALPSVMSNHPMRSNMNLFAPEAIINTEVHPELLEMDTIEKKADLAYALQRAFENVFVLLVEKALSKRNVSNIVISGGCALNILGNSAVKKAFPDINFFIDPIAHDASLSSGCAMYTYRQDTGDTKVSKLNNLFLGYQYDVNAVSDRLKNLVAEKNV